MTCGFLGGQAACSYWLIRPLGTVFGGSLGVKVGHRGVRGVGVAVGDVLPDALVRPRRVVVDLVLGER